jgi:rhamnogalacturonyl hydrolase YesR
MRIERWLLFFPLIAVCAGFSIQLQAQSIAERNSNYVSNREPLASNPYVQLPLGSIVPKGWLYQQLKLSADGMSGHLDEIWSDVGPDNGWLGGKGDSWERGPYWLDGLLPLAYILNDRTLKQKTQKWIEWSLEHQREDGYFGPIVDTTRVFRPEERVLAWQEKNKEDWWPHMVMLKVMEQYYEATQDRRVLGFTTKYFKYQLKYLPSKPLDHWTHWAKSRGGENLSSIYWLYNHTGDSFLLELGKIVFQQTENWTSLFEEGNPYFWHGVNTGMCVKQPAVYYQYAKEEKYLKAVKKVIDDLMKYHGQVEGTWSGDEMLHGTDPTQGTELCTVVEYMFSLETLIKITGDPEYAEKLERAAFNALPAQVKPDFTGRQYYQMPNQIVCDTNYQNFNTKHWGTILFGLDNGYGCCTANYHQGWPKFAAHLWFATQDNGLGVLVYAPSEVTAKAGNGVEVKFSEETQYPFDGKIMFTFTSSKEVEFPFHLRIPAWCNSAVITINGKEHSTPKAGTIAKIARTWKRNDKVEVFFPMEVRLSRWHEESVGVERGPLVFALRIGEEWRKMKGEEPYATYAVYPKDPWNYGLAIQDFEKPGTSFTVQQTEVAPQPWTIEKAPVRILAKARKIPEWQKYGGITGPIPWSPIKSKEPTEEVTLVPYGCTKLRISEFPVIDQP